jgi:ADP-ribose pyrophosphatase YjhB (NUDIX family)
MAQFNVAAFVVIFDKKGRVLLSHRRDLDLWNLPGGKVESGEMPIEAAIRETKEETGLKVKIKELVGVYGKSKRDEMVFLFQGKIKGGKLKKTAEADQHKFFKIKKLPVNTIPKHKERILDAVKKRSEPVFTRQKGPSGRDLLKKLDK